MTDLMDDLVNLQSRRRRRLSVAGLVVILVVALALGWAGWQFLGSGVWARAQHADQIRELRTQWESGEPAPPGERAPASEAYAILRVPEFGAEFEVPVRNGTEPRDLRRGVGAYASSVRPGQIGNLAIAGYRTTHGAPFGKLLELDKGDEVEIETREAVYTYVLDVPARDVTVGPDDAWVLDPVPGTADEPTQPTLTLTTSQDLVHSPDRSVAFGHLGATRTK
ncbi:MAG: sortase [Propionibacteriaceae bacterium]|nr:sortase [Propionibacteriaceae bacterium]